MYYLLLIEAEKKEVKSINAIKRKIFLLLPWEIRMILMDKLLAKINYKGDDRICILNGERKFIKRFIDAAPGITIDKKIDTRYLYGFIIVFVKNENEVDETAPAAIHNLYEDGILWFIYPKETPENSENFVTRKNGWSSCKSAGFEPVRHVCIDDNSSATRFRNKRFISRRNTSKS